MLTRSEALQIGRLTFHQMACRRVFVSHYLASIAAEQREAERRKREVQEEQRAVALTKRKFKQEAAEVLLGVSGVHSSMALAMLTTVLKEREEVSAELRAAQMQGYRNELRRQGRGASANNHVSPRVREPEGGLQRDKKMSRELYRKRQAAGAGIPSGSIAAHERNWNETVSSLFTKVTAQ